MNDFFAYTWSLQNLNVSTQSASCIKLNKNARPRSLLNPTRASRSTNVTDKSAQRLPKPSRRCGSGGFAWGMHLARECRCSHTGLDLQELGIRKLQSLLITGFGLHWNAALCCDIVPNNRQRNSPKLVDCDQLSNNIEIRAIHLERIPRHAHRLRYITQAPKGPGKHQLL